jgi:diguanylate cyclase (GGDEF)-like protein
MQDLDDGVRVERGTLAAVSADPAPAKVRPFTDHGPVVPAQKLLDTASALSDGATLMHSRLQHLDPDDRHAVLDLLASQLSSIVHLWTELVAGIVPGAPDTGAPTSRPADRRTTFDRPGTGDRPSTTAHPSAQTHTTRSVTLTGGGGTGEAPARTASSEPPEQTWEPESGVRLLPRRPAATSRAAPAVPDRELWTAPLRAVKVEEPDDHEGDRLTRDELTGVFNRQAGFAALGRELDRCRRAGERFVLGYLNVDGLKEVNATEGPRRGDELLRQVTAALRATLRSYDVIMRLGGDEFLFSLPGADMTTAELRAHEFGVILAEEAPGRSASVGFGELRGNDTLDEIISRAELELVKNRRSRLRSR